MKKVTVNFLRRMKTERYLDEKGNVVFTERFLAHCGACCGYGCRHCPYSPKHQAGNRRLSKKVKEHLYP